MPNSKKSTTPGSTPSRLTPPPLRSTTWTSEASAPEDVATPPTAQTEKTCPVLATTPPRVEGRDRRGTCDNSGWPAGARETLVERASPSSSSKQESEDPGGPSGNADREAPQPDPIWGVDNSSLTAISWSIYAIIFKVAALLILVYAAVSCILKLSYFRQSNTYGSQKSNVARMYHNALIRELLPLHFQRCSHHF